MIELSLGGVDDDIRLQDELQPQSEASVQMVLAVLKGSIRKLESECSNENRTCPSSNGSSPCAGGRFNFARIRTLKSFLEVSFCISPSTFTGISDDLNI